MQPRQESGGGGAVAWRRSRTALYYVDAIPSFPHLNKWSPRASPQKSAREGPRGAILSVLVPSYCAGVDLECHVTLAAAILRDCLTRLMIENGSMGRS